MATTTIQVAEQTAEELHDRKRRGDSYDDVIRRLLEANRPAEQREAASSAGDVDGKEKIRCQHCGYEWSTGSDHQRPTCPSCSSKTDRLAPTS